MLNFKYILIFFVLAGLFSPTLINAQAKAGDPCNNGQNTLIVAPKGGELTCQGPAPKVTPPPTTLPSTPSSNNPKEICIFAPGADTKDSNNATNAPCANTYYNFLTPLPCEKGEEGCVLDENGNLVLKSLNTVAKDTEGNNVALGKYLNLMLRLIIGIAAVLAMVMIVMGGIQYMTSELPHMKEGGKERITNAVFGLILALGSYLLLSTINPDLLKTDLSSLGDVTVSVNVVDAPEGGDISEGASKPALCGSGSTILETDKEKGFCMQGTFATPDPTYKMTQLVAELRKGYRITSIFVKGNEISFNIQNGSSSKTMSVTTTGHGANGWAESGQGKEGDRKTPKGTWSISSIRLASSQSERITNKSGQSMGAVAIMLNVGNRGIAIHGNSGNKPGSSAGCVLMYNDDLLVLAPYLTTGISVVII